MEMEEECIPPERGEGQHRRQWQERTKTGLRRERGDPLRAEQEWQAKPPPRKARRLASAQNRRSSFSSFNVILRGPLGFTTDFRQAAWLTPVQSPNRNWPTTAANRLTQADGRRSVINRIEMPKVMRIRVARWPLRALSLLTIVALLVAPNCEPLCAGQNCRRIDASDKANESCHGVGTAHHEALLIHGIRNCNLPELPAIISTSTPFGGASGESHLGAPGGMPLEVEQGNLASAASFPDSWFCRPHDLSSEFTPAWSGVLRI